MFTNNVRKPIHTLTKIRQSTHSSNHACDQSHPPISFFSAVGMKYLISSCAACFN